MRYKILVIDDEKNGLEAYRRLLEAEGFSVIAAESGREGYLAAVDSEPDLVLCDVAMPKEDGLSLLKRLRGDRRTKALPVILMSAVLKGEEDQSHGIDGGADDYLAKPISAPLLAAKVRAVLRRHEAPEALERTLKAEGIALDVAARTASCGGKRVALTRKEFDLLAVLLRKAGRVLSVPFLLETVWGYDPADYNDPHTVGVHISSLRKKLGPRLGGRIVSVPGLGYRYGG